MERVRTWEELRRKTARGEAVILEAAEFKKLAETASAEELAERVDAVTVATFAPMCSSGAVINFGHASPPLRMERARLNGVPAYGGLAAVDVFLGATEEAPDRPGYGGAHVIEDLVAGREVYFEAGGKGTDCYPGRATRGWIDKDDLNEFWLFNPRNAYQNYGAATNSGPSPLRTYLGALEPDFGSVSFATAGELSPLLNDPLCRAIGAGSPVFTGGARGCVVGAGTQYDTCAPLAPSGVPERGARTLAILADAKEAEAEWLAAANVSGYGVSLFVGIGFVIPVFDAAMARALSIRDRDIPVLVRDYARPERPVVARTDYASLRSGRIEIDGRPVRSSCSSSLRKAKAICAELARRARKGSFPIRAPYEELPAEKRFMPLRAREKPRTAPDGGESVASAWHDRSRCVDCGACIAHCPRGALSLDAEGALIHDALSCAECGGCVESCLRLALGRGRRRP